MSKPDCLRPRQCATRRRSALPPDLTEASKSQLVAPFPIARLFRYARVLLVTCHLKKINRLFSRFYTRSRGIGVKNEVFARDQRFSLLMGPGGEILGEERGKWLSTNTGDVSRKHGMGGPGPPRATIYCFRIHQRLMIVTVATKR